MNNMLKQRFAASKIILNTVMLNHKFMKLSLIFSCFLLLVACSTTKQLNNLNPVAKINENKVFFENGGKGNLAIKKGTNATVIYLVRHAEKAKEGGRDPLLTQEGTQRALRLSQHFKRSEA